jgi:hypothetical protein
MNSTNIRKLLKEVPKEVLLEIIMGLYNFSPQNMAFIRTRLSPIQQDTELLELSRKQVIRAIYSNTSSIPHMPRFGESRKVIRTYQKATSDLFGTLDLMLLHVELGTQFTRDFGDIDEPFYMALETMLGNAIDLVLKSPNCGELYNQYRKRFEGLEHATSPIGWGFGDSVSDLIGGMQSRLKVE